MDSELCWRVSVACCVLPKHVPRHCLPDFLLLLTSLFARRVERWGSDLLAAFDGVDV